MLHAKDHFSKYCQLYPLPDKQAATVAQAMVGWIEAFRASKIVQSDNSREFKKVIKELLLCYRVKIIYSKSRTLRT